MSRAARFIAGPTITYCRRTWFPITPHKARPVASPIEMKATYGACFESGLCITIAVAHMPALGRAFLIRRPMSSSIPLAIEPWHSGFWEACIMNIDVNNMRREAGSGSRRELLRRTRVQKTGERCRICCTTVWAIDLACRAPFWRQEVPPDN